MQTRPFAFLCPGKRLAKLFFASLPSPLFAKKKKAPTRNPRFPNFKAAFRRLLRSCAERLQKKKKLGLRNPLLREIGGGGGGGGDPEVLFSSFPPSPPSPPGRSAKKETGDILVFVVGGREQLDGGGFKGKREILCVGTGGSEMNNSSQGDTYNV